MANWIFSRPLTCKAIASFLVCFLISSIILSESEYGGSVQVESPEWIPASSICSIIPAMITSSPSDMASTSTSIESLR